MIIVKRSDGAALVLDSARCLTNVRQGLVVDYEDEMYIVKQCSVAEVETYGHGHFSAIVTIYKEWCGWPSNGESLSGPTSRTYEAGQKSPV